MNDPGSARMASWGMITDRLARADAERAAWLESKGVRRRLCALCDGPVSPTNVTGYCDKPPCRRESRRVRYIAWKELRLAGKKGKP